MSNGNIIICGFPGVGKTTASKNRNILDMESSGFHYKFDPLEREFTPNPDWPTNYLDAIEQAYLNDHNEIILTSTHEDVVLGLLNRWLPVIVVVPEDDLRNEYMIRYLKRGSDPEFIYRMYNNWHGYIEKIHRYVTHEERKVPIISLKSGQYLSDVLPMY